MEDETSDSSLSDDFWNVFNCVLSSENRTLWLDTEGRDLSRSFVSSERLSSQLLSLDCKIRSAFAMLSSVTAILAFDPPLVKPNIKLSSLPPSRPRSDFVSPLSYDEVSLAGMVR